MHHRSHKSFLAISALIAIGACGSVPITTEKNDKRTEVQRINPENWPVQKSTMVRDAGSEALITNYLSRMTLEEKVGQILQADIASVTPAEAKKYNLGSILNGGNSAPKNDVRIAPSAWLDLADEYWIASTDTSDGGIGIPLLWGTDAVHGHNNIVGATVFPHNIGLGAANNPALMKKIGQVTAKEMLATGLDWTFAPTIAVVRDDRWGRTYESYSESPEIVASYAGELVEGIQGKVGTKEFLGQDQMIATVKHFVGDGGTIDGRDQGNNVSSEAALRDIQAAGYPVAIEKGVQVVMASFNAYHGRKMHGHKELLTDVLVGRMGFDGFVVGDWNGHGQVQGCTNGSCAASFNAGLDMFMAPDSWKQLYYSILKQVKSGDISMQRLDEAVARVLRVKIRAGLFEAGLPSDRRYSGKWEILGSEGHRAVARDAVRQSLVLLKNNNNVLPLSPKATVLVAGDGADNIGKQAGGWTLSWQGTGNSNDDFPNGQSIFDGVRDAVSAAGGTATLSVDGSFVQKPDVAIVVFGENPYAEFQGDVEHLDFADENSLALLRKFRNQNIPTISVFLSGRPMWVNPEINVSDAFVAGWLPGGQGGGVADVLFANADGTPAYDFRGRLSFSWPRTAVEPTLNVGDEGYDPLFPYQYGLTYQDSIQLGLLPEVSGLDKSSASNAGIFVRGGDAAGVWRMAVNDAAGSTQITDAKVVSASGGFEAYSADAAAQEDTRILKWTGPAIFAIEGNEHDFSRQANGDMALELRYNVLSSEVGPTEVGVWCSRDGACSGMINMGDQLRHSAGAGWQTAKIKLSCFADAGADMTKIVSPFVIQSQGPLSLQIASAELATNTGDASCSF